jgi:hypothetical protein
MIRLPFDPIDRIARARDMDNVVLAELCGVAPRAVSRWRERGLSWSAADRVACALGRNAEEVWGDEWNAAADVAVSEAIAHGRIGYEVGTEQMELAL